MKSLSLLISLLYLGNAVSSDVSIKIEKWQVIQIPRGWTPVEISNVDTSTFTSVVLQATGEKQLCISTSRYCKPDQSFSGKSVGMEMVFIDDDEMSPKWYLFSNTSQKVFLLAKGYSSAPVVGVCSKPPPRVDLDPNLHMDYESHYYTSFNFSYATLLLPLRKRLLSCDDSSYWSQLTYDIYVLPWNQRFERAKPKYNSSSLYPLSQALYRATSLNVLRDGVLIHSFAMKNLKVPRIRIWRRLGLDYIVTLVVRIDDDTNYLQLRDGSNFNGFYVSQNIYGCSGDSNHLDCGIVVDTWAMIIVGAIGLFGISFAHLGRRIHRLNTFFSGFCIGSLMIFALLTQLTNLHSDMIVAISLLAGGTGLGVLALCAFWKAKPSNKMSHLPLYLTASFLIVSAIMFTPLGNQSFWENSNIFYGVFYGTWIAFALFVFLPFTNKMSVDLCVAIIGSYLFVFCAMVIFLPGSVFPYLLLDSIFRMSVPGGHNALSISWISYIDVAAFIVWPSLIIVFLLINHFCTPALDASRTEANTEQGPRYNDIYQTSDTWPPLPPDAYVSERTPLMPTANMQTRRPSSGTVASAPPPYMDPLPNEAPPSYSVHQAITHEVSRT